VNELSSYIDSNVLIHALRDPQTLGVDCSRLLSALELGSIRAFLDPVVVHELTYVLRRVFKSMSKADVASMLIGFVSWPGIDAEKEVLTDTLQLWADTPGLSFADALLATRARLSAGQIFSKNIDELRRVGATVPDPLPSGR
jgi:predicted nucleic acid-binding protein